MGEVYAGPGARTCAHSGCNWPAAATLGFDYESRASWLDDLSPEEDPSRYDLCNMHADRFSPPRGWRTEDRRRLAEPVFGLPEAVVSPPDALTSELKPEAVEVKQEVGRLSRSPSVFPNQSALPDI